ncbi:MAG: hypothetical protein KDJ87_15905 [Rhizobiaceae bacterium]|nr:hypothetical protein [Rhizobiaceae bacterium]
MAQKIKGKNYESVVVTDSNTTVIVDEKAVLYSGGEFDDSLYPGYGIVEDIVGSPDIGGNTYRIDGRVKALFSAVATFGDDTTIKLGKTADVSAALGIGVGNLDLSDLSTLETLTLGTIATSGENSKISIAKGASVSGLIGASILGESSSISNNGDISGTLVGMIAGPINSLLGGLAGDMSVAKQAAAPAAAEMSLINNGLIESAVGMIGVGAEHLVIENGKKGEIVGFLMGIGSFGLTGTAETSITNAGTIRVTMSIPEGTIPIPGLTSAAILGFGSTDTIRNTGKIYGDIVLLDGDDTVNNSGGKIVGDIFGGTGDDTLVVGRAKDVLVELSGEGTDTVKSAFTYTLSENVERLLLLGGKDIDGTGNAGDNYLKGNKGDNVLTGDLGADTFAFATKGGKDTIADFSLAEDTLDLSGWKGMTDLAALDAHAKEKNGDVWITVGKDVLIVADHTIADLHTATILFETV